METEHESLAHHRRLWCFLPKGTHAFKFSAVLPICGMRESDVRVVILGFLLAGLGTVHSFAQTTHDPDVESRIVALENVAKVQARKAKDIKTLDAILDDDFVEVEQEGRVRTKAGFLA
jgi:hypothetical protein